MAAHSKRLYAWGRCVGRGGTCCCDLRAVTVVGLLRLLAWLHACIHAYRFGWARHPPYLPLGAAFRRSRTLSIT